MHEISDDEAKLLELPPALQKIFRQLDDLTARMDKLDDDCFAKFNAVVDRIRRADAHRADEGTRKAWLAAARGGKELPPGYSREALEARFYLRRDQE